MNGQYGLDDVYETDSLLLSDNVSRVYFARVGSLVTLFINATTTAAMNPWTNLGASNALIPARMRPTAQCYCFNCLYGSRGDAPAVGFSVGDDGSFIASNTIPANSVVWATVSYVARDRSKK